MKRKIDWDKIKKSEYKCDWCRYRHNCFIFSDTFPTYCRNFVRGGCYSCKYYYGKNGEFTKQETDQWFKRGCEIWCCGGCDKRKRLSRKRKKQLKKRGLI